MRGVDTDECEVEVEVDRGGGRHWRREYGPAERQMLRVAAFWVLDQAGFNDGELAAAFAPRRGRKRLTEAWARKMRSDLWASIAAESRESGLRPVTCRPIDLPPEPGERSRGGGASSGERSLQVDRAIAVLMGGHGWTTRDVAEALGITERAVRSRSARLGCSQSRNP